MRRKHADEIIAWANGAELQYRVSSIGDGWREFSGEPFKDIYEYRIKPAPKPDVVQDCFISVTAFWRDSRHANIKLTWDDETGKLKSAAIEAKRDE